VNLNLFKKAKKYPGYFNRVITPANVIEFENAFRKTISETGLFEVAGEVCFWKNYSNFQSRNRITLKLLTHLQIPMNWISFTQTIERLSNQSSYNNFITFRDTCNQPRGFATPLTFLAFYNPTEYPMVDKHIAYWWVENKAHYGYESSPIFSQRGDGWVQTYTTSQNKQNWVAYISWTEFCRDYARRVTKKCKENWRARDVEMAVWEAQKHNISLNVLPLNC